MDGLKISLRKILFCAFKRRLTAEVKVAQFSGYVSEHSMYHHGEASLNGAIVNMAQNFVGSNNINLLEPKGQFGTRMQGGDDSASERYIFTQLNELARSIFPESDDQVLTYINDDGTMVEPEFYVPIIPFALVNGQKGIGTGFSTSIPPYNPLDLIQYLRYMLGGDGAAAPPSLHPYYEGFQGTVMQMTLSKYLIKGVYEKTGDDRISITELPIGTWTMPYITFLEELLDPAPDKAGKKVAPLIKDFANMSTETNILIHIVFPRGKLAQLEAADDEGINGVHKLLKLTTTVSTTNMNLFTSELKLKKYDTPEEIIADYFNVRMDAYVRRKKYLLENLEFKLLKMTNKARYIQAILDDVIDLRKKTNQQVEDMLTAEKFDRIEDSFKYLTKLPMDSVSKENVEAILREREETECEFVTLKNTSETDMWLSELKTLEEKYISYKTTRVANTQDQPVEKKTGGRAKKIRISN
jgi:DNA topoisomerase II